ncbi:tetratricopeptide repeat protein [Marinobacter flavimaris]|jgi:predicted Zn-dependent protease|uniref:Tetratricopeptide repeat protein n=2 Tax=Marinobacter TaxID=2742 RepID=A0A3D8H5T3_9GAMM|nr:MULTISPECIES: tetratricopeptide repeat protein [Marinobacter]EHJ03112.1 TPR repeat-containing protein [Marinobacter manganoxydans MnI7-9]PPI81626.1 tetratricopeptide repeat protein [Marinobacter flavimaris]RDU42078.1 tetratricopeptide repeat protein [Marinobacter flavimaris]
MHKSVPFLFTCLLGLTLAGCASLTGTEEAPAKSETVAAGEKTEPQPPVEYADFEPETLYLLLSAEIAAQRGRYDITLVNYLKAAKQSRDQVVIERAMRIAQSLNGDNAQKQLAELWLDIDPDNLQAHRISAIQAVKGNDLQTAIHHMERIMDQGGDADFDSLAAMAANLPPEQQQELLALYNEMSDRHPDTPELEYSIALLLKVTGQPQQALDRLEPLLQENANFQPAIILKGDLLYQTGQKSSALDYLLTNTRRFPGNRQMGTLYGRMLINEGELQAAQDEFNRLVKRYPDTPGLRLSHALVALENGQTDLARQELTQLAEQGHHTSEANYYLGRIEDQASNTEQAIGYYQSVEQGNYYFPALARASSLLAENGQLEDAIDRIRRLREANPRQAENFWLLEVNLLLDQEQQQQALSTATEALEEHPDNIEIRYARAMLYDGIGRPADAEADLKQIIEQEPENAVALNALGYILTTRTDRLREARGYIEKALRLDPNNPAILDSMGWVLFLEGQLEPALEYLSRAWAAFPDPEVAAHYGEALWMNGAEEQARIIWQEGLEQDSNHEVLRETIDRLTNGGDTE